MSIDLQALVIKRILKSTDIDLYSNVSREYFTNYNLQLFQKIQQHYIANQKLPTLEEFAAIRKDLSVDDYFSRYIYDNTELDVINLENIFIVKQLQDAYIRTKTLDFVEAFLNDVNEMESEVIIDTMQSHILELNQAIPEANEFFDAAEIDIFSKDATFTLFPSGLSSAFDSINGGLALSEHVLLGGRRGSGKSIISLNMARHRVECGQTVAFFTIEMRYKEVYDRLMSSLSGVDFMKIYSSSTTEKERLQVALAKLDFFYEKCDEVNKLRDMIIKSGNYGQFNAELKTGKYPKKPNRLFIIDDPKLTISRIDHYCNTLKQKYTNFNMAVIDYINIVQAPDRMNWQTQIGISDSIKMIARRYELTTVSPYQIAEDGEARFAKGILDSADKSFIFMPVDLDRDPNTVKMHTAKIRNGQPLKFDLTMNWPICRVVPGINVLYDQGPQKIVKKINEDSGKVNSEPASELIPHAV